MSRPLSFFVFLTIVLAVLGGMHGYLWMRLIRDPGLPDLWRRLATALLVLLALSVPLGMFSLRLASGWVARVLPAAAFAWLGIAFVLFCAVAAIDLARLSIQLAAVFGDWLRQVPEPPADPSRRLFVARAVAGGAVIAAGGATALAVRSASGPAEINEVPVRLERLPPALSGMVLAQITDLHVGPTLRQRTVRRVVEQTNALRPDVIAITGDLVDGSVPELGAAVSELARLRARHGVYFVTGNHEYYSGVEPWLAELRRLGIRVLQNERVEIGDRGASIDLAGVDDWSASRGAHDLHLQRALAGRDPGRGLVLLAHQPRGIGDAVRAGVELQLSGHTHGGQIMPFNLAVAAFYPYVKGLHTHVEGDRSGQIFVSKGTGFWGPPMRLGVPPEISKIVLV